MLRLQIPIGHQMQELEVPAGQVAGVCMPGAMEPARDPASLVDRALAASMEATGIEAKARLGTPNAAIVVTDRTRSTPLRLIVPALLDRLNALGVPDSRITVISGGGMHAADSCSDLEKTLGHEVLARVRTAVDEPDNDNSMTHMGTTSYGTPVEVLRCFAEAEIKVGVTNVNSCMLAGWSGGGKIVLPGVASRRTIYENHKRFTATLAGLHCASLMGVMPPENAVRADIEEAAAISGIDMVVNTLLDPQRQLVDVCCGDQIAAQRAAVAFMAPYVEVCLPEAVDVLVSAVGDPALEVSLFQGGSRVCGGADRYLRPGGTLILVNDCAEGIYEGFEHEEYRSWMRRLPLPAEISGLVEKGAIGGEKGCVLYTFSWLLHEMKCRIVVVTGGMSSVELEDVHLGHAPTVQQAVDRSVGDYSRPTIGVMPYGGLVLPVLPARR